MTVLLPKRIITSTTTKQLIKEKFMSSFKANENYGKHVINMDYTSIQNAKALAMDNDDWSAYDSACEAEKEWESMQ